MPIVYPTAVDIVLVPLARVEPSSTLSGAMSDMGWSGALASGVGEALRLVRGANPPDLLAIAADRAEGQALELCRAIKLDTRSRFTAVVLILSTTDPDSVRRVFECGADDFVAAGAPLGEITMRLSRALSFKHAAASLDDASSVITSLAAAVEGKDHYTCGHVERVGAYAVRIGRAIGLNEADLATLRLGGVVHDIGKVGIPDQILNKPGKLTPEEMDIVKRHPVIGYEILKPMRTFRAVLPIVRWHHEKPNGTGYPDGLKGDQIPTLAKIASVADVFDALSTERPYRAALPLEQCRQIMLGDAQRGDLDPELVGALLKLVDDDQDTVTDASAAAA